MISMTWYWAVISATLAVATGIVFGFIAGINIGDGCGYGEEEDELS